MTLAVVINAGNVLKLEIFFIIINHHALRDIERIQICFRLLSFI